MKKLPPLTQVRWFGEQKEEVLSFFENAYSLPPGSIAKCFFENAEEFLPALGKIIADIEKQVEELRRFDPTATNAKPIITAICRFLRSVLTIRKLSIPAWFADLIIALPVLTGFNSAAQVWQLMESLPQVKGNRCSEFTTMSLPYGGNVETALQVCDAWETWLHCVEKKVVYFRDICHATMPQMILTIGEHVILLKNLYREMLICFNAGRNPFTEAKFGLEELNKCCTFFVSNAGVYSIDCFDREQVGVFFGDKIKMGKHDKTKMIWNTTSFTALLALELEMIRDRGLTRKKCAYCHRYYWTNHSKSIYCQYPLSEKDTRTCKDVGAQAKYNEKGPIEKIFRKNYIAYNQWVRSTVGSKRSEFILGMRKYLLDASWREPDQIDENLKALLNMENEVKERFNSWKERAGLSIREYTSGNISEEECLAAIRLLSLEERSPIRQAMVKEYKAYLLGI